MNSTAIAIVGSIVLCAAGIAYSQGWFNWTNTRQVPLAKSVGDKPKIEREKTKEEAAEMK